MHVEHALTRQTKPPSIENMGKAREDEQIGRDCSEVRIARTKPSRRYLDRRPAHLCEKTRDPGRC